MSKYRRAMLEHAAYYLEQFALVTDRCADHVEANDQHVFAGKSRGSAALMRRAASEVRQIIAELQPAEGDDWIVKWCEDHPEIFFLVERVGGEDAKDS